MCCSLDAGMAMVNLSIDLAMAEGDPRYYMDSMKLHKLLYLSQCDMLQTYGRRLFADKITAHNCGPYVDGIRSIPAKRGFGLLKERFDEADGFVPPSVARLDILERVLKLHGKKTADQLSAFTQMTGPYQKVKDLITSEHKPEITLDSMKDAVLLPCVG